ncbi:hypothetical protein IWX63_001295 [Arthrobacter sp. CAN_A2]
MIQTVLELDLADYPSDHPRLYDVYQFERQSQWFVETLDPGSYVRLRVGSYMPHTSREFFRADLMWQITAKDPQTLKAWHEALEGAPQLAEF